MKAPRLLPPVAWTALIAWFSGEAWSAEGTAFLTPLLGALLPWADPDQLRAALWLIRKAAHVTEYAVLAALWSWALAPVAATRRWPLAFGLSVVTAALDETHQATTLTRTGSVADVLLDAAGAGVALALSASGSAVIDRATGLFLWTAAVGGTALIAVNWTVAASSHWLWVSVPAAWIALGLWRRRTARA